ILMAVDGSSCVDVPPFLPRPCALLFCCLLGYVGTETNTSVPTHPPTNTAIRCPCWGANPRVALNVQSPVPSQTIFPYGTHSQRAHAYVVAQHNQP
ncbi:hypothetical protein JB92DRAFT_3054596, partial [Gautieria morchelliformis]